MKLEPYGWTASLEEAFAPYGAEGYLPGRVVVQRGDYEVVSPEGFLRCHLAGRMKFHAGGAADLPVVGDWVTVKARQAERTGRIEGILPRKSRFIRKVPGSRTVAQVIAANIDTVFLVSGLDDEFNPARMERYLVLARESGAQPVIVLNKADLCPDLEAVLTVTAEIAPAVPLVVTSVPRREGIEELRAFFHGNTTGALLGSSGVGKSSLINQLLGEERFKIRDVRETDSHGRHTTTHRELVLLPSGGMVIDTPGLRELQLWGDGAGLQDTFEDVEELALQCKFTNCLHETEPGCAVRQALDEGRLEPERLESYRKLQREFSHLQSKYDVREKIVSKQRAKRLSSEIKRYNKHRDDLGKGPKGS
ncbi:MAG TPA: ribosome small subunit-dependent GTPase A [Bacteroidota bacterium]